MKHFLCLWIHLFLAVEVSSFLAISRHRMKSTVSPGAEAVSSTCSSENTKSLHNFGPASKQFDQTLFTAERPGDPPCKTDAIPDKAIGDWIHYMKEQEISVVISLLEENEYGNYRCGPELSNLYEQSGMRCYCQPMQVPGAAQKIFQIIRQAQEQNEKVVVHCTGGVGRAGRVAAGWLVTRYGMTPQEATKEVMETAESLGIRRKGSAEQLEEWLRM